MKGFPSRQLLPWHVQQLRSMLSVAESGSQVLLEILEPYQNSAPKAYRRKKTESVVCGGTVVVRASGSVQPTSKASQIRRHQGRWRMNRHRHTPLQMGKTVALLQNHQLRAFSSCNLALFIANTIQIGVHNAGFWAVGSASVLIGASSWCMPRVRAAPNFIRITYAVAIDIFDTFVFAVVAGQWIQHEPSSMLASSLKLRARSSMHPADGTTRHVFCGEFEDALQNTGQSTE